ncbi:hypothetical protein P5673_019429 [Acropora cervicornis]|uniref:Uncharacterized protein n=1 Tax=Acropora cervicornis TaxID=6130 RepID=A0AAD9V1X8_ACRCE|nr:hypothetical protein P5673_019429 [Acropora cervicornis]
MCSCPNYRFKDFVKLSTSAKYDVGESILIKRCTTLKIGLQVVFNRNDVSGAVDVLEPHTEAYNIPCLSWASYFLLSHKFESYNKKEIDYTLQSNHVAVKNWQAKVENTDAHIVYKNEVTKRTTDEDPIEQEMVGKPRNVEQLRNLKKMINRQQRLTWDEIYNVHEMALDMENFVHRITTFPDMVIICGLKQV